MELNGIRPHQTTPGTHVVDSKAEGVSRRSVPSHFESDRVELSKEAEFNMSYVQRIKDMPEVRPELVEHFKSRIQEGNYPPPAIIDGLTHLLGKVFLKASGNVS
jgi:anti-sigma28 factor (negative regulator of flagellin synthesis)